MSFFTSHTTFMPKKKKRLGDVGEFRDVLGAAFMFVLNLVVGEMKSQNYLERKMCHPVSGCLVSTTGPPKHTADNQTLACFQNSFRRLFELLVSELCQKMWLHFDISFNSYFLDFTCKYCTYILNIIFD